MDWTAPVDGYCERLDPGFWAEPVNAVTNAAFLLAAFVLAWRLRGTHLPLARALTAILAAIGVGSFLFHTFAQPWAGLADTLPILLFILTYLFAATRDFLGRSPLVSALVTLGFFPFAAVTVPLFRLIPGLGDSAAYAPVPLLMAIYAGALWRRANTTARGLVLAAALLATSITLRALDAPLCAAFPLGTHFLWHVLNAVLLAWTIEVYRRHMAGVRRRRLEAG
ncbi:MAG: ceramidase domain-containing protein [Paracoccaceae bacterium]